jgi:hypothetical protein
MSQVSISNGKNVLGPSYSRIDEWEHRGVGSGFVNGFIGAMGAPASTASAAHALHKSHDLEMRFCTDPVDQ